MNRRAVLGACSGYVCLSVSGCITDPGTNGRLLEILAVQKPPGATVTPASDAEIRSVTPIQTALNRVAATNGTADLRLDHSEFDATAAALSPLPWYERDGDFPSGIYLRHNGSTYVASLWPYCSDSVLGSAASERGVYGRGGCLNPDERPGTP